jgi:hypothetical protein
MMNDSILTYAGSVFFAAWSLVIAGLTLKAFGRELLPSRAKSGTTRSASLDKPQPFPPDAR